MDQSKAGLTPAAHTRHKTTSEVEYNLRSVDQQSYFFFPARNPRNSKVRAIEAVDCTTNEELHSMY